MLKNDFMDKEIPIKKILVTGGTGFVGTYLVEELISQGASCRLLVRPGSNTERLAGMENVEFWTGDITRPETLEGIGKDIDYVYHLAAEGHVSAISDEAFQRFISVNVEGTKNLITECSKSQITKFVHFSSTAAMGLIKKELVNESDMPQPVTPYQKSKLVSEAIALKSGEELGVPVVIVRPCMIYGVNGKGEFLKMCQLMRKGLFPRVGFGRNLTPLVHVRDLVQGAVRAAEKGVEGEAYLLASECSIELNELRNIIMEAWGTKAIYPYIPAWFMFFAALCFEIFAKLTHKAPVVTRRNIASTIWDREFSIDKARRELGYYPKTDIREGIFETVEWFKSLK